MNQLNTISLRSRRRQLKYYSFLILIIIIIALQLLNYISSKILTQINSHFSELMNYWFHKTSLLFLAILGIYSLFVLIITLIEGGIMKNHNPILSLKNYLLKNKIDKALVMDNMFITVKSLEDKGVKYAKTPKVKIINEKEIKIENLAGLDDKLESFKDEMTVVLDKGIVVDTFQKDITGKYYVAEILNLNADNQYIFKSFEEYLQVLNNTEEFEIPLMQDGTVINLSKTPHMLISGLTGSGKSYSMYHLMYSLILKGHEVFVIDRKQVLTKFDTVIGSDHVADENPNESEQIFELIERVNNIMLKRQEILKNDDRFKKDIEAGFRNANWNNICLVIDELGALTQDLAMMKKAERDRFYSALGNIAMKGRNTGVSLMISLQQANAQSFNGTGIRDQLSFKMVLGNSDRQTREVLFSSQDISDVKLKPGQAFYTKADTRNKPGFLFMPTFDFELTIPNLEKLIELQNRDKRSFMPRKFIDVEKNP